MVVEGWSQPTVNIVKTPDEVVTQLNEKVSIIHKLSEEVDSATLALQEIKTHENKF